MPKGLKPDKSKEPLKEMMERPLNGLVKCRVLRGTAVAKGKKFSVGEEFFAQEKNVPQLVEAGVLEVVE